MPFTVIGESQVGGTLTVQWHQPLPSGWSFAGATLYSLDYPANDTFGPGAFFMSSRGFPSIALPMALQGLSMRFIVQFQAPTGHVVTEDGPVFTVK